MALDQNTLSVVIKVQTKGVGRKLDGVRGAFDKLRLNAISLNQALELLGKGQALLGRAFDLTIAKASKLQLSVAEITTLLDSNTNANAMLTDEILDLQAAYGSQQTDLAKSYYNAISSGAVGASNANRLLDASSKLAVGGVTNLENASSGLTSIMNSYEMGVGQAARISDTLFLGMKAGVTTIEELATELGDVTGIAHQMRVPFNELVASIAGVTTSGINTNKTITAVRSALIALANPSEEMKYAFHQLGISSIEASIAQDGFANTIQRIIATTDGSSKAITGLFGAIESLPAVTAIANKSISEKILKTLGSMKESAKNAGRVTEEAFRKIAETTDYQMGLVQGRINAATTRISSTLNSVFLPILKQVAEALEGVVKASKELARIDFSQLADSLTNISVAAGGFYAIFNAKRLAVFAAAMAPVATKFVLIGVAVVGAAAAIDILIRNIQLIPTLMESAWHRVRKNILEFVLAAEELNQKFYGLFGHKSDKTEKAILSLRNSVVQAGFDIAATDEKLSSMIDNFDLGIAGQSISLVRDLLDDTKKTVESIGDEAKKLEKIKPPKVSGGLTKEQLDLLKQIKAENEELQLSIANVGASQVEQLNNVYSLEAKRLDLYEKELKAQGNLTDEIREQLNLRRDLVKQKLSADIAEVSKGPQLFGPDQLDMISKAMGSGIADGAGMLSGAASGALGFVGAANIMADAVQGLIDFVSQFIDKVAGIFNSLTNLPNVLLKSVLNLNNALRNIVSNFIPNVFRAVPDIILSVIKTAFVELPQLFIEMVSELPEILINEFIPKIPEIVKSFITGIISQAPKLIAGLVRLWIGLYTKALPELIRVVIEEVPQAIIDGIKVGLNEITKLFEFELFKGFDIEIDEPIKKLQESFTGVSEQLFSVLDIEARARGLDLADRIGRAINGATTRASNLLQKAWDGLVTVWRWIWDNLLNPIIDGFSAVFRWVDEKVFQPILSGLRVLFSWLESIWQSATSAFNGAVNFLKETWDTATSAIRGVFDFLKKTFDDATAGLQGIFNFFKDLIDRLTNVKIGGSAGSAWEGFKDAIGLAQGGVVPLYAAAGAMVPRGTDTVPAMLTPGEFVVRREAVNKLGIGALRAINNSQLPQGNTMIHIDLDIHTTQQIDRNIIRSKIVPAVRDEIKRASLDGAFVISKRGLR